MLKGIKRHIIGAVTVLFAVNLVAAGCSNGSTNDKVRVAEVTRSIFYAPQYVAIEKGFFEEEGIDIELTTTWGGDKTMTTLLSDGADVALVGSETSIYVYAQGTTDPVINFAQLTQTDGTFLVAREKPDTFNWEQLKDSTFLGQRKGGMPQMAGEFGLKKHGIDPHNDMNLIQNVDFGNIPNAFASGTGDYVQLFEPTASLFEKEGIGHVVASFGTESGKLPYTTFMSKESYINQNKDIVERFTKAVHKAQQWVDSHSAKEIAAVIEPYFEDTPIDLIESSTERYKQQHSFATNPILDVEEWNNLQTIMDEAGELPKQVEHSTLVNTEIAESVAK
ncbi:ABC transporter substrate-binding protein [Bacillus sp. Marseille-Q3570]|uniref:ABC transporter substrate-binding protein n=1 Tax=Bacillus sp. Marseille-Q3570 TaxID=2963522 RepID=UPI0021B837E5|nr:ABC transporter substrate-binding protein [Bacillus sp. Marseille-Q3570]